MKTKRRIIPVLISLVMLISLFSCEKKTDDNPAIGKVEFSLDQLGDISTLKSALTDSTDLPDSSYNKTFQLMISLTDRAGNIIMEDKLIPLYVFGSGYISEKIEIDAGEYLLKKFMVLNNFGKVIYAAPLEGSPRAYLVNHPLPLHFTIYPAETTKLAPEVIPVGDSSPADFGYATFGIQIVKPVTFWVMAMNDNPLLMRPSVLIEARLYLKTQKGWSHEFQLMAKPNRLEIVQSEYYEAVCYAEGFPEVSFILNLKEVMLTSETNPYVIKLGTYPPYETLVLQPGPDKGKDARITDLEPDKNFGNYKYFETTYMSEDILTVMRTTRSLIWFDLAELPKSAVINKVILSLMYDIPIYWDDSLLLGKGPWDSTYPWYGAALQQIVNPWEEAGVSWNNQPKTVEYNQVFITPFVKNANFINVDVTSLFVQDPNTDGVAYPNYGMMLKLYPDEGLFPGMRFASSDYPEANMRPKLTVQYFLTPMLMQPGS